MPEIVDAAQLARQEQDIARLAQGFEQLREAVAQTVVGQQQLIDALIMALLCRGHVLIEGVPGLAKTLTVNTLAAALDLDCRRIQFTPDLLPSDLVGTPIFHPGSGEFRTRKGPVFTHMLLADEINRAPAKVQSALLEAMEEGQVTLGEETFPLPQPFLVMATQNPIEHEGTYPLPEAQVDRFLFKALVGYPSRAEEAQIVDRLSVAEPPRPQPVLGVAEIDAARAALRDIHLDPRIRDWMLDLVTATRDPQASGLPDLAALIEHGVSPRGSILLARTVRAHAFLQQRAYVVPDDVLSVLKPTLRHRLRLSYEADVERVSADEILQRLVEKIAAP